jgi:hypothetical protein
MMILLILVLLGVVLVAGYIAMTVIEEKRDETWKDIEHHDHHTA